MDDWKSVFQSKTFTLIVSPEKQEFVVHSESITKLSPYFNTLINGEMAEARKGEVVGDDTDMMTFGCLIKVAYYGD
ncbi:uncharacterized protein BCR38DRAFT_488763 [Pseudomassariella vexata]|uniref:BTB domain-containing protein n=1 Tax=Pseudomassariella vexata TaxID=1141098 RepID=A0A1Y2DKF1_9PEZI|nr:uncharacterized protein BCR38DRAFT_488763 [Pseudomassariella vexata]ORY59747.1 hypothetical protein BCR38DRAFT_488763 [Pseudomassariella vexata]